MGWLLPAHFFIQISSFKTNEKSRFLPSNRFWYEDLIDRAAPLNEGKNSDRPQISSDINYVDETTLEISRATNLLRGSFLFLSLIGAIGYMFFVPTLIESFLKIYPKLLFLAIFIFTLLIVGIGFLIFMIRRDISTPRDTPIRFNRKTNTVQIYEFNFNKNPFGNWAEAVETFKWNDLQAEISKQSGFNGKAYVIRYALELVVCKPGTTEVIYRTVLKGNDMTVMELYSMWSYIRRYMAEGIGNLPRETLRKQEISFRRSFFTYMPYLDPSEEGREIRNRMGVFDVRIAFVMSCFFWIWSPMGVCHYIAMHLAPETKWCDN